jgi:zinc protease
VSGADRGVPPPASQRRPFRFPEFSRERLANGLELVLAPRRGVPLVEVRLQLPAGGDRNPLGRPGLAALTASLLDEGTAGRSGPDIATAVERLGGSLATHADWNAAGIEVGMLARDLDVALELVAEIVRAPAFPPQEVERLRRQALTELLRRRDQPALLAEEALARVLYAGSAYGFLPLGDEATMTALSRDEILTFHASWYRPSAAALLVAGDFEPVSARRRVTALFGDWSASAPGAAAVVRPVDRASRVVMVVDREAGAQTELRLAHAGVPRTHPDRTRLGVLNALLGGKFTSRLNLNLRERHGFTYGVSSRFVDRRGPGPFVVAAAVANEVVGAATRETLSEIARLRTEAVGSDELAETRDYLLGVFPYTLQTHSDVLARLAELTLWQLPDDHYERALEQVATTTPEHVLELAQRHLAPDAAAIVAVGPATTLTAQLEEFGKVEVVEP